MSKDYYSECEHANQSQIYVAHHWMRDEFLHRLSFLSLLSLYAKDFGAITTNGTFPYLIEGEFGYMHSIGGCIALAFNVHKFN